MTAEPEGQVSTEKVSAKSVLAWAVHITPNEWAKFMGDDRTDKSLATILLALRLLVACEEVGAEQLRMWMHEHECPCPRDNFFNSLASPLEGGEDRD
jgi:hypothetical protein